MAGFISRVGQRCVQALAAGLLAGCVSVLVDFDHVICAVLRGQSIVETYGCRLLHPYLLPLSCLLGGVAVALGIGLLLGVVEHTAGRAA